MRFFYYINYKLRIPNNFQTNCQGLFLVYMLMIHLIYALQGCDNYFYYQMLPLENITTNDVSRIEPILHQYGVAILEDYFSKEEVLCSYPYLQDSKGQRQEHKSLFLLVKG